MKTYLFTLLLLLLMGCQTVDDQNDLQGNITEENTSVQDNQTPLSTNKGEKTINIVFSESNLYSGQKAKIDIELLLEGQVYSSSPEDFSYRAVQGKIIGNVYHAPENGDKDSIVITHIPSSFEKEVSFSILSAPKLTVEIENVLPCNDVVAISPKVLIGDISQNFAVTEFEYTAQVGKFSGNSYYCPANEVKDTITIYYRPLSLKKEVAVSINAKPVLTIEEVPASVEKNDKITFTAFLKKAQNRENINISDLAFSANIGNFNKNIYSATNIGSATITIKHTPSGQKLEKTIIVKDSLTLVVNVPSKEIENFTTFDINPILQRDGKSVASSLEDFLFTCEKGTFENNLYKAPGVSETQKQLTDKITISHKTSKLKKEVVLKVNHSKFRTITTARFSMPIPSSWTVINEQMGFIATSYSGKYRVGQANGSEIKALALSGFNFLEPQTVMVLFQQQGGVGKNMEKVGEDEVNISGVNVTRILFESNNIPLKKSWWMIFKHERVMYLLTISGEEHFFQGNDSEANQIINNFKFNPLEKTLDSLVMSEKSQLVDEDYFSLSIPEGWKSGNIFQVFFASSDITYDGEKVGLFVFAHRSREIQSMDLSLILLLFRQEIVKDPTMKISDEQELVLPGNIPAKMVVFSGGQDITNKMWLIAIKHDYTGYVMVLNGPQQVWDENPDFANKIKDSFKPKN